MSPTNSNSWRKARSGCLGGKSEFIRLGELNDIDLTVGHHSWEGGLVVPIGP